MNFIVVSDTHVLNSADSKYIELVSFLKSKIVSNIDEIYFLGDIFDLMAGFHMEYFSLYREYFNEIVALAKRGVKIHYVEGNHDMHLSKIYSYLCDQNHISQDMITIYKDTLFKEINNTKYYLSHGDELGKDDPTFKKYKRFIKSSPISFIANNIMPLKLLNLLGGIASKRSYKVNHKGLTAEEKEEIKQHFRNGIESVWHNRNFEIGISGHSHVLDMATINGKFKYYNISSDNSCLYYYDSKEMDVLEFKR